MNIRDDIKALHEEITAYRRAMHKHPQTAYEETFASDLVQEKLSEWGIPFEAGIAITGVIATIEGQKTDSGKVIGLRADMDALDIQEEANKEWCSTIPGKMHGCGHDGHTAMLLGAAKYLKANNNFNGTVHLIFQPAEEGAGGAYRMLDEGLFERFPVDEIYGVHNWPRFAFGQFATKSGPLMAASDRFEIDIHGKGGHAASPHTSIDPIIVGTQIVNALQTLISRENNPVEPAVISVTNFKAGSGAFNVIPERAYLSGTLRTFGQNNRIGLKSRIGELAASIAASFGATATTIFDEGGYAPTINTEEQTSFCCDVAASILGNSNVDRDTEPVMGAEDFGAYLLETPGCFVFLGQHIPGNADSPCNHMVHTPQYDFNDAIIPLGIEYWVSLVEKRLPLS